MRKRDEFFWVRLRRELLKPLLCVVPRHTIAGRILRTRGCKKLPNNNFLIDTIRRLVAIVDGFPSDTDLLFLGSSHIQKGIAPAVFTQLNGWNAGVSSGDLKMAFEMYSALRTKWTQKQGQAVVLGQDFWLPSAQAEYSYEYFQTVILHLLLGIPYRSTKFTRYAEKVCSRILSQVRKDDSWKYYLQLRGLCPMPIERERQSPEVVELRAKGHLKFCTFEPTELGYLDRLKRLVEADNRKLILLRTPHRSDYLATIDKSPFKASLWDAFDCVAKDLPVIDKYRFKLPDNGWNDADHLSEMGAQLLTQTIEPELLALLNRG